jgi:hypothetical protein
MMGADTEITPEAGAASDNGTRETPHDRGAPYAVLTSVYAVGLVGFLLAWRAAGRRLPERIGLADVALLSVATHRGARTIAKDKVTTFLRTPFTEYQGPGGPGEVEERPVGTGLRRAVGELLVCPFCLAQWIASALGIGLVVAPRLTRFVCAILSAVSAADFLQLAYRAAEDRA